MAAPAGSTIVLDVQEIRLENQGEKINDERVQEDRLEDQEEDVGQREEEERGQPAAEQVRYCREPGAYPTASAIVMRARTKLAALSGVSHAETTERKRLYLCMYIYIYIYIYNTYIYIAIYIYIYIYIIPPNKKPPLIRNPPLGVTNICYYQFIRRHDYLPHKKRLLVRSTPLIRNPPLIRNQPLEGKICVAINLYGGTITPLIRNDFWSNLPRILKNSSFVLDRRSIDLLTKYIRTTSEI